MNPTFYYEDTLVQETTADYLADKFGWDSIYAASHEDFGIASTPRFRHRSTLARPRPEQNRYWVVTDIARSVAEPIISEARCATQ